MTIKGWVCAVIGYLLCLLVACLITWDITLASRGMRTISDWCLETSYSRPWLPALLGCVAGLIVGMLLGHLWFPQKP